MCAGVLVLFGVLLTIAAVYVDPELTGTSIWGRDFASFYGSASACAAGRDPYLRVHDLAAVNVNLPHVVALLTPLAFLPILPAFLLWQALQLSAWACVLLIVCRSGGIRAGPEFVAAAILFPGTLAQIALGQWAFAVALLVTLGWLAHRRGFDGQAGIWLGLAASVKPFVALLPLVLLCRKERRAGAAAFATMALIFAAGIMLMGVGVYERWLQTVREVTWGDYPLNASLQGFALRTLPQSLILPFWASTSLIVVATTMWASLRTDSSIAWSLSVAAALLVAPLGWVYYVWILVPMLVPIPRWSSLLKAGLVMLWIPPALLAALSTATAGLLVAWLALILEASRARLHSGASA